MITLPRVFAPKKITKQSQWFVVLGAKLYTHLVFASTVFKHEKILYFPFFYTEHFYMVFS